MILRIKNVLDSSALAELRAIIDAGSWVDGNETSGHQSRLAKRNHQLAQGSEAAQAGGRMVLEALSQVPEFVAAALPLKVFPPLFNRYEGGETFGAHVDNSIRRLDGTDFRIRSDLSATLFLADPDSYGGGELIVEDLFGEHRVKLPAGDLVLYPASSVHRDTLSTATLLACKSPSSAVTPPNPDSSIDAACSPARTSSAVADWSAGTTRPLPVTAPPSAMRDDDAAFEYAPSHAKRGAPCIAATTSRSPAGLRTEDNAAR